MASPKNPTGPDRREFLAFALVFGTVYFFSLNGLGALPNLTIDFLLKEKLKLSAAGLAYFQAVTLAAWVVKPLWGFLSDSFPICGTRRKSYLILSSSAAAAAWLALSGRSSPTPGFLLAAVSFAYMAYALQDVVTDGLMVEAGKPRGLTGEFQSIQWACVYAAMILTAFAGGFLSDLTRRGALAARAVFAGTALFPVLTLWIAAVFVREERNAAAGAPRGLAFFGLFRGRDLWVMAVFLFFWNFSPSFGAPFFYYAVDKLKFTGSLFGMLQAASSAAAFLGCVAYGRFGSRIPVRRFLVLAIFAGVAVILLHLLYFRPSLTGRPGLLRAFAFTLYTGIGFLNAFVFLALLNLTSQISPVAAGGTVFAFLTSFYNLGLMGSSALGGFLFPRTGLKLLILVSAAFSLAALVFIPYIPVPGEPAPARNMKKL